MWCRVLQFCKLKSTPLKLNKKWICKLVTKFVWKKNLQYKYESRSLARGNTLHSFLFRTNLPLEYLGIILVTYADELKFKCSNINWLICICFLAKHLFWCTLLKWSIHFGARHKQHFIIQTRSDISFQPHCSLTNITKTTHHHTCCLTTVNINPKINNNARSCGCTSEDQPVNWRQRKNKSSPKRPSRNSPAL